MKLSDRIRQAIKAPNGMCRADFADINERTLQSALFRLKTRGVVHVAKISHKKVRYFDTPERANACVSRTAKPKPSGWGVVIKKRAPFDHDAPLIFTEQTKYTFAPKPPQPTHTNTHTL